jgi:hypothetical protein
VKLTFCPIEQLVVEGWLLVGTHAGEESSFSCTVVASAPNISHLNFMKVANTERSLDQDKGETGEPSSMQNLGTISIR